MSTNGPNTSEPQLLIVEDEPAIADALQFVLRAEGFTTSHAPTLGAARSALQASLAPAARPYDLVILDIGLPDGSGFDLCREMRHHSQNALRDTPILFLSARHEEIDRILGLELGADDYVVKPFSPREVAARIRAILRRRPAIAVAAESPQAPTQNATQSTTQQVTQQHTQRAARTAAAVPPGPIYADLDSACARVHGEKVELTRNELLLLHHLQTHPGKVYSRRQLMEAVWEEPDSAAERTVDTHIKSLRKKIPAAPIATHRGFGYSWQTENNH